MSEERLQEIKDSISLQYQVQEANDLHNFNIFTDEEQELVEEIERLNNIIKEQGLEDKSNYYVKGLEGSLKEYQDEVKRLNNIINDLLKRQNEALNYISNFLSMDNRYKHGNGNDELELVRRILNKHNQESKGSDIE